jgi:hypothetical protein
LREPALLGKVTIMRMARGFRRGRLRRLARSRRAARVRVFVTVAGLTGLAVLVTVAGCGSIAGAQRPVDQAQLMDGLADRVAQAQEHPYTAVYLLPGGVRATMARAQQPARVAYLYPAGELTISPTATAVCHLAGAGMTCTLTLTPSTGSDPGTALVEELERNGLIAPSTVANLLTTAAVDHDAQITQHDTTIAARDATCIQARNVGSANDISFTVCVTDDGMVGSFTGTIGGALIDIQLDHYLLTAADDVFGLPKGAQIVDDRPPSSH